MSGTYDLTALRRISAANYIAYQCESLHPDRVMPDHDLVYLLEGEWEICQNGSAFILGPDDVILLHAGQHHYGRRKCAAGTKTMYIHASCALSDHFDEGSETEDTTGCIALPSLMHSRANPAVRVLFEKIISVQWSDLPQKPQKLALMINLLLCELGEHQANDDPQISGVAKEIVGLIQSTPQCFFTTRELADRFFLGERTLVNRFKRIYGCSIYRYQLDTKLATVSHFLVEQPDTKLREVALNFGFFDEFHLSKSFKKKYGLSPYEYRQKLAVRPAGPSVPRY